MTNDSGVAIPHFTFKILNGAMWTYHKPRNNLSRWESFNIAFWTRRASSKFVDFMRIGPTRSWGWEYCFSMEPHVPTCVDPDRHQQAQFTSLLSPLAKGSGTWCLISYQLILLTSNPAAERINPHPQRMACQSYHVFSHRAPSVGPLHRERCRKCVFCGSVVPKFLILIGLLHLLHYLFSILESLFSIK